MVAEQLGIAFEAAKLIGKEDGAVRRFLGGSDLARLLSRVDKGLEKDSRIPERVRDAVRRTFNGCRTQPDSIGAFYRYLESGEAVALTELADQLESRLPTLQADEPSKREIARIAIELIDRFAPEAFRSDRESTVFEARRTRNHVTHEGERTRARMDGVEAAISELVGQHATTPLVLVLPWAPDTQRILLDEIGHTQPELVEQLDKEMADLDKADAARRSAALILAPEPWLLKAPANAWAVLAGLSQRGGRWSAASLGWEEASRRHEAGSSDQLNSLMSAAVAAGIAGQSHREAELLERVRAQCPDFPRLVIEEVGNLDDPGQRMERLESVAAQDDDERALLHLQTGLAHLMNQDLAGAERELSSAEAYWPERLQTRMLRVNIAVQRARNATIENSPISASELQHAQTEALAAREELLEQARVEEAVRLLMLATDAALIDSGPELAQEILGRVTEQEASWSSAPSVLGEVALRAQDPLRALWLTRAAEETADIRRIRAVAMMRMPGVSIDTQLQECSVLEELLVEEGADGEMAAAARIIACLHESQLPWSSAAEHRLVGTNLETAAAGVHVIFLARSDGLGAADKFIEEIDVSPRVLAEIRFQAAREAGAAEEAATRAREMLEIGADQIMRVMAAMALKKAGDSGGARSEAQRLADDPGTPIAVRQQAFQVLADVAEGENDWERAHRVVWEWLTAFPSDDRANQFLTRVGSKLSSARPE